MSKLITNGLRHLGASVDNLTLDNAGRVLTPNNPAFDAWSGAGNVSFTSDTSLPLNSTNYNIGGHYNTSTYRFTAPVAGLYFFRAQLYKQSSSGACRLRINKNGAATIVYHYIPAKTVETQHITTTVYLAANDYINCVFQADSATDVYLADNHTNFAGFLIG